MSPFIRFSEYLPWCRRSIAKCKLFNQARDKLTNELDLVEMIQISRQINFMRRAQADHGLFSKLTKYSREYCTAVPRGIHMPPKKDSRIDTDCIISSGLINE